MTRNGKVYYFYSVPKKEITLNTLQTLAKMQDDKKIALHAQLNAKLEKEIADYGRNTVLL